MNKKHRFRNDNAQIDLQNESISNNVRQLAQKDVSSMSINSLNRKPESKSPIYYTAICFMSLLLFLLLRIINDPNKYEWCDKNGWPEGIGDCFNLGIEHFVIDASSLFFLIITIVSVIRAIIIFFKEKVRKSK